MSDQTIAAPKDAQAERDKIIGMYRDAFKSRLYNFVEQEAAHMRQNACDEHGLRIWVEPIKELAPVVKALAAEMEQYSVNAKALEEMVK